MNVKKVITKVNHIRENSTLYNLGIDTYISPKDVTANKIVSYVRAMQNSFGSNVEAMSKIVSGKAEALEFVVKRNMPFINVPLMDLRFKKNLKRTISSRPKYGRGKSYTVKLIISRASEIFKYNFKL